MPLTATVNGEEVVATTVAAAEWAAYRGRKPWPVLSCGADGHAKTSHLGNQFFAHATGCDTDHKGESAEHLRVKAAIIAAATALGWAARAEVPADDRRWVADVLAERDGRRVAFEVQLSGQVEGGYQHRQQRYAAEGIECYWLTRRARPVELKGVPALHIRVDANDPDITVAEKQRSDDRQPLERFIAAVLVEGLHWDEKPSARQTATVRWGMHRCTGCDTYSVVWDADDHGTIRCEHCLFEQAGQAIGRGAPKKVKADRGVEAPNALLFDRFGEDDFRCPACRRTLDRLSRARSDLIHDTVALPTMPLRSHWCAPAGAISAASDVLQYIAGTRLRRPQNAADSRSALELTAAADRRYDQAKALEVARQEQQRQHQAAEARARRWRAEQLAQTLRQEEAAALRRGDTRAPYLDNLRQQANDAALQAHLAESGKAGPDGPAPPWWGDEPRNAHERTVALDMYTQQHLRVVDDLVAVFPPMTPECVCYSCRTVHNAFDRHQRQMLWPDRSNGRNLHPDQGPPRTQLS